MRKWIDRAALTLVLQSGDGRDEFTFLLKRNDSGPSDFSPARWRSILTSGDDWVRDNPGRTPGDYLAMKAGNGRDSASEVLEGALVLASQWPKGVLIEHIFQVQCAMADQIENEQFHHRVDRHDHMGGDHIHYYEAYYGPSMDMHRRRMTILEGAVLLCDASDVVDVMAS